MSGQQNQMERRMRLAVFDLDGTLVDSQARIVRSARRAFRAAGLPPPAPQAVRRIVGLSLEQAIAALLPRPEDGLVTRIARAYRDAYLADLAEQEVDPLFAGARDVLDALRERDLLLGIATGKSRKGALRVLEAHGLLDHFVTLQTADRHPSKPHPAMLEAAMAEIGAEPETTLLVGDTTYDIDMARAAGALPIGVSWGNHPPGELAAAGAVRVLARFDELLTVIEERVR